MVTESWFSSWRWNSRKGIVVAEKTVTGIMAFEVAGLMAKVISLWNSLEDKEVRKFREEVLNSVGIRKLVTDNDDYLMDLALNEIIENFGNLVKWVARLGKRCTEPSYHRFDNFLNDTAVLNNTEWFGWGYKGRKMEKKIKKMEKFVAATIQLTQELEVLTELEQNLRRMHSGDLDRVKVLEFQQQVMWQREEVRNLREMSLWVRSYDYVVRLLIKSLFSILERIKHVYRFNKLNFGEVDNVSEQNSLNLILRSHSVSEPLQSSGYTFENNSCGFASGPLGRSVSKADMSKTTNKPHLLQSRSVFRHRKHNISPFGECMISRKDSPITKSCKPIDSGSRRCIDAKSIEKLEKMNKRSFSCSSSVHTKLSMYGSKQLLTAPPAFSLGDAALALHYANLIILIEKLALSPHMIGDDVRDDLYRMLPTTLRTLLRDRVRPYARTLGFSLGDTLLVTEWRLAVAVVLEWLAPIAHNTVKWQSERKFEQQHVVSGPNILLVQTLHFANREKTEAVIVELLIGLNFLYRMDKECNDSGGGCIYNDG